MSQGGTWDGASASLSASQADFVDRVCDRFEAAWRAGRRPAIEDHLDGADGPVRAALLRELIAAEVEFLRRGGEPFDPAGYERRFPDLAAAVRAAFGADPARPPQTEVPSTLARSGAAPRTELPGRDGSPGEGRPRYRVLRPHARGGLGEVFVAEDTELHREVALKEIRPSHADDPESRARFVLEAEVTGRLEHPGVVPVYGLGFHADGRPYYAMRFIRGDSLKEAVARFHGPDGPADPGARSLEFRLLLRRFVDICNAVAYAHSRGVLHRDLKPGNVMLGPYGETLVVDWGLAKVVQRSAAPGEAPGAVTEAAFRPESGGDLAATLPGSARGTPAFMSPEQAAGRVDELGPASDVYGLGAVLYHLLTGRSPFEERDVESVLWRVVRGDFPRPRAVSPGVDRALEAVCLKAMALQPEDRYGTPRALADDVERWLADEPVSAWREPVGVRLRRWGRRHRPWVVGAAALLVVTTAGLAAGALLLKRANGRTELRRLEAEAQKTRAEANFALARDAVDKFFTTVSEEKLLNEPRMDRLRKDLLGTAREFYRRFAEESRNDPRVRADLGVTLVRLSIVSREVGDTAAALAHASEAVQVLAALDAEHPGVTDYRVKLAQAFENQAALLGSLGRWSESGPFDRRAIAVREGLVEAHPGVSDYRVQLAQSHNNLAIGYYETSRWSEAEVEFRRAIDLHRGVVATSPSASRVDLLAATENNLGNLYHQRGRYDETEALFRSSIAHRERLVREHPEVNKYRSQLAATQNNLGNLYTSINRRDEARAVFGRSIEQLGRLAETHPEVVRYRVDLAKALGNLGIFERGAGRLSAAETSLIQALGIARDVDAKYPESSGVQGLIGILVSSLGKIALERRDYPTALERAREAVAWAEEVVARRTDHMQSRPNLLRALAFRSLAFDRQGRHDEALADMRKAVGLARDKDAQAIHADFALTLARAGRWDEARAELEAFQATPLAGSGDYEYYRACLDGIAASAALADPRLTPSERAVTSGRHAADAVAWLRRAGAAGMSHDAAELARLREEPDLAAVVPRPDFQDLERDLAFPTDPFTPTPTPAGTK